MEFRRHSHRSRRIDLGRRIPASSDAFARLRGLTGFAVAVAVVVVGPGSFGMGPLARHPQTAKHSVQIAAQPSHAPVAPALEARVSRLTDELEARTVALKKSPANRRLSHRVVALSRVRQPALRRLVAKDPSAARGLLLPARLRRTLARLPGAQVERKVALRGWYRVWHHDDFRHPAKDTYLDQLVTRAGKAVTLHSAGPGVSTSLTFARLKPGRLAVRGWRLGNDLLATHVKALRSSRQLAASSATSTSTVGTVNVAVIVGNFADSTTSIDMNALRAEFQGNPGNDVVSYFNEASYGKATIVPSFYGPYRLAENTQSGCGSFNTSELMQLANADVDFTQVKRVVFVGNCKGFGAVATNEAPTSTPDGTVNLATVLEDADYSKQLYTQLHELSHTLGNFNFHASWYDCSPDAFTPPTSFDRGCDTAEYADHFDVLGGGPWHHIAELDPYHKANAGWLSSSQFPNVTTSGTYTLAPYESPGSGIAALSIPRGSSGTNFTVEYRQPIGFDSWMGSVAGGAVTHGASIRLTNYYVTGNGGGSDTELIDTTPGTIDSGGYFPTDDALDGALLPGKSFTDPEYGITINAVSASTSGLVVNVTVPTQTCTRAAPRVAAPSPNTQSGSGLSFSTTFVVTNMDSSGCPANKFRFMPAGGAPGRQYVASPDIFTLAPGASITVSLNVSLERTSTSATYAIVAGEVDSNTYGSAATVLPSLTYQLTGPTDTTAPGAPGALVASALGSGAVSLNWAPSTDNLGVVGYKVARNGSTLNSTTATSFLDAGLAASATYSYTVRAFDLRGNLSPAAMVSVTTPAKRDSVRPTPPMVTAAASDHTLTLSWTPSLDLNSGVAAYRLSPCLLIQCTLPATATSVQITGLPTRWRYDLTVSAVDADGNTASSDTVTVYTAPAGGTVPAQPQTFYSPSATYAGTKLAWAPSSGATSYQVFRNSRPFATVSGTTFTDTTPGGHEYSVQAVGASGALSSPTQPMYAGGPTSALPDSTPPTASVNAPASGATVNGTVTMTAQAADNVGVTDVEFYVDGVYQGHDASSPYTLNWDTTRVSNGVHWLRAIAYDQAGNIGSDGGYTVTTLNGAGGGGGGTSDTTPPTVSITAPAGGTTVSDSVSVSANASDNVGATKVEFSVDGSLRATDTASPYGFTWDASVATPGTHTISAKAYDAAGNTATSSVSVTVPTPSDTTPPTVGITSPVGGATVSGAISVDANASDDTAVTDVDLSIDGAPASSLSSTPWRFDLDTTTLANGTHTLTVTASDPAGNSATDTVSVNVQNAPPPPPDATLPSKPGSLKAAMSGTTQVQLFWSPSTDNVGVVGYDVYRDGTVVAQTTLPNFLDSGLTPGTNHVYSVRARDAAGNVSIASSNVNGRPPAVSTSSTGTLAGVIFNASGRPAAGVIVQLTGTGITKNAKTNTSGLYKFTSLPPGAYTLTMSLSATAAATPGTQVTAMAGQTILVAS